MILAKLLVALGIDSKELETGLQDAERKAGTSAAAIGKKLQDVGSTMVGVGTRLTLGVTTPIVGMGVAALNAASDLDESMNKVGVVFGEAAGQVQAFADTSATALGISEEQALEASGTFGNLFTAIGLGQQPAADMSTSLVTLAADLASFNNVNPEEALAALRSGLVGETEPLKRFGVNMNAAGIAAKAMQLGLVDLSVDMNKVNGLTLDLEKAQADAAAALEEHGEASLEYRTAAQEVADVQAKLDEALAGTADELTPAQKAQAAYALIMEQTATAQGDFARTSDGLANQTRIAKAQLGDLAATMGGNLLPIGLKLATAVNSLLEKFTNMDPETQKVITVIAGVAAAIGPVLVVLGSLAGAIGSIVGLVGTMGGALGGVAAVLTGPVGLAIAAIVAAIIGLKLAWDNNFLGIRDTLTELWESKLKPAFEAIGAWLSENIPKAIEILKQFWEEKLLPALQAVWAFIEEYIIPLFEAVAEVVGAVLGKAIEALAGLWQNVLWPALQDVWAFIRDKIIPIFEDVANVVSIILGPPLEWFKEHVLDPLKESFSRIGDVIEGVIGWLKDLANSISNIDLPDWLTPGSPTPFELGLRGIADAMRELAGMAMPEFAVGIGGLPAPVGGVSAMGGGGPRGDINITFRVDRMDVSSPQAAEREATNAGYLISTELRRRGLMPRSR